MKQFQYEEWIFILKSWNLVIRKLLFQKNKEYSEIYDSLFRIFEIIISRFDHFMNNIVIKNHILNLVLLYYHSSKYYKLDCNFFFPFVIKLLTGIVINL